VTFECIDKRERIPLQFDCLHGLCVGQWSISHVLSAEDVCRLATYHLWCAWPQALCSLLQAGSATLHARVHQLEQQLQEEQSSHQQSLAAAQQQCQANFQAQMDEQELSHEQKLSAAALAASPYLQDQHLPCCPLSASAAGAPLCHQD